MSSGFVTETEIEEAKLKRQEEWDRVRQPDDPLERPEAPYESRSLFERLQEQKQKKDLEFEEAHKLKNMIKTLDDDEIEFLDLVDRSKIAADRKMELEEELELSDYRSRVATLQEKSLDERLQSEIVAAKPKTGSNRHSQQKLLKGIVVKRKVEEKDEGGGKRAKRAAGGEGGLKCVAILPGLGCYSESTSSDEGSSESDSDDSHSPVGVHVDMLGRIVVADKKDD